MAVTKAHGKGRTIYVDDETWKRLRQEALNEDTTAAGLIRKLIDAHLEDRRNGRRAK